MSSRVGSAAVRLVAAASVMGAVLATAASGEENTATKVEPSSSVAATAAANADPAGQASDGAQSPSVETDEANASKPKTFKVGDTVKLGDWTLIVNKFTDPVQPSSDFMGPDAGKRWIAVDATVGNNSDKEETVSSIMCFDVRDGESRKYTVTIGNADEPQLDGSVAPGGKLRGVLTFEVPKAAKDFTLHFNCDIFSSGSALVDLS